MSQSKYLESLTELYQRGNFWRIGTIVLGIVCMSQTVAIVTLSNKLSDSREQREYILAPGIQSLQTVRPGILPNTYIEESFKYIVEKINSFTWTSIEDNFKSLFENWYSHNLQVRTEANLQNTSYFEKVKSRNLVSVFKYLPKESQFHWCGKVKIRNAMKGVACGIVSGVQDLYSKNVPISSKKVHFLIFATNKAPTQENPFAIKIERLKRADKETLEKELKTAMDMGVLPEEGESNESS
jgi:hypothetical protein